VNEQFPAPLREIAFGGGCHWCTEAVFQPLRGVVDVKQGWIASSGGDESFSEGVIVRFDPRKMRPADLVEVHLRTHRSQSGHSMRDRYRSAVYYMQEEDAPELHEALDSLRPEFSKPLVTRVLPFQAFRPSREEITDYYLKNKGKPFCETYIEPKLEVLKRRFSRLLSVDES
jgi:peptide-methionine (S)-S-oxide reductase